MLNKYFDSDCTGLQINYTFNPYIKYKLWMVHEYLSTVHYYCCVYKKIKEFCEPKNKFTVRWNSFYKLYIGWIEPLRERYKSGYKKSKDF